MGLGGLGGKRCRGGPDVLALNAGQHLANDTHAATSNLHAVSHLDLGRDYGDGISLKLVILRGGAQLDPLLQVGSVLIELIQPLIKGTDCHYRGS